MYDIIENILLLLLNFIFDNRTYHNLVLLMTVKIGN